MKVKVVNKTGYDISDLSQLTQKFFPFAQKTMGFDKVPNVVYASDLDNAQNPLGRTAHYEPQTMNVTVYVDGRHIKDILRSLSHELVHHTQNCRGEFNEKSETRAGYAQEDGHLREMEREAYELGNLCFRDWEDSFKQQFQLQETIYRTIGTKGDQKMSIKDWKNQELHTNLMEKWGYIKKEKETLKEELGAYMDTSKGGDYKTAQKHLPEDELDEGEESSDELSQIPQSVEAIEAALEGDESEEEKLREAIRDIIKELS